MFVAACFLLRLLFNTYVQESWDFHSWAQAISELLQNKQHAHQWSNTYSLQWCQVKGQMSHSIQKFLLWNF